MNRFIAENNVYDIFQSAFRRGHSTETALQQILNNIYSTVSPSISCQRILLCLSCAFDSLSHTVLISSLEIIGIRGTVLKCFSSYILNRSSSVQIYNFSTKARPLHYGVPMNLLSAHSSLQYTSSLYMILLVNFQMSTIIFTLIIFNYIPSYPTSPMYYQITHKYVNMHQLSDHDFYLTTFYLTLQNLHS